jgi:hypothetical protein
VGAFARVLVFSCVLLAGTTSFFERLCPSVIAETVAAISERELAEGIAARIEKVPEFRFIREEAAKMGVKVYLFGGTAAGFGHYVKWDLLREKGDSRFQPDRFDYDYTNIYRSTQDLDIVLDGSAEQARMLQASLQDRYPHFKGSKTAWEVRLLRSPMGDKEALLDNPDYLNQHTDSNSTGMIEVSKPQAGENIIKDLRDWQTSKPHFLKDLSDGSLHYYHSPSHHATARFKNGENPEIFSAVRYLTKAFQYELKIPPEDLQRIQEIIARFDSKKDLRTEYSRGWLEKNGKKLMQHAVNLEYAWDTLEKLGLRKKLVSIKNDAGEVESLAWWLSKEPLRSFAVGKGQGRTAAEIAKKLGVKELKVAHETKSFLAYESITRAHTGDPNVLISRQGSNGETAIHGDGFYTRIGDEGAAGTGLTIRFAVDPAAREGSDFTRSGDYLIFKNKAALRVIPESLNLSPLEYFRMLSKSDQMDSSDRGIFEKLKRRIGNQMRALGPAEEKEISEIVESHLTNEFLVSEWFSMPVSANYPKLVDQLRTLPEGDQWIAKHLLSQPVWGKHPEWVEALLKKGNVDSQLASFVLTQPHWADHPEWLDTLLSRPPGSGTLDWSLIDSVLRKPHWVKNPKWATWVSKIIERGKSDVRVISGVLLNPASANHPEWVRTLLDRKLWDDLIATHVLSKSHWANHPEFVETILERQSADAEIAVHVLRHPQWANHVEWVERLIKRKVANQYLDKYVLHLPQWKNHPKLREACGGADPRVECLERAFERGFTVKAASESGPSQCSELFGGLK